MCWPISDRCGRQKKTRPGTIQNWGEFNEDQIIRELSREQSIDSNIAGHIDEIQELSQPFYPCSSPFLRYTLYSLRHLFVWYLLGNHDPSRSPSGPDDITWFSKSGNSRKLHHCIQMFFISAMEIIFHANSAFLASTT